MKLKVEKVTNIIIKVIYILLLAGINICVFFLAADTKYSYKRKYLLNNISLWLLGCVVLLGGMALFMVLSKKVKWKLDYCVLIGTIVLFGIQVYICKNIYFETAWDAKILVTTARQMGNGIYQGEFDTYFSYYPNNMFLTLVLSWMSKAITCLGDVTRQQYLMPMITLQCLISCATGIFIYKSIRVLINEKWALGGWFFYIALLGLNPWLVIVYSDSMALFFSIVCFYLYLKSYSSWKEIVKWIGIGILGGIGYLIKPQTVIIFIACVLVTFIQIFIRKEKRTLRVGSVGITLAVLVLVQLGGNQLVEHCPVTIQKEVKLPITHWVMMGLHPKGHGAYNRDDVLYTESFTSTEEMKKANCEVIKERVKEYGAGGMLEHLKKKTLINFADGNFAWRGEGSFFYKLFPDINSKVSGKLKGLFYYGKSFSGKLRETFVHGVWLQVLIWMMAAIKFVPKVQKKDGVQVLMVTLIGTVLFSLLFEARARYLMCNVSVYIVLAVLGIRAVYEALQRKELLWKNNILS